MARLPIRKEALRDLAIRSKNKCAFPGCDQPILNLSGVYIAELCHIEAAEPGGQRFNPAQSDEERRAPANLLFLCHQHHKETDDEVSYSVARLREMKQAHEALPEVVFNSALLLTRIEEVLAEQAAIRKILAPETQAPSGGTYSLIGPELQDAWSPDVGRFYETRTGPKTKFKYMMRDGWLHIEQQLEDGAIAYYEVNEAGAVRNSRLPYPIDEYRVLIPEELVLSTERVASSVGTHAIKTTLKWSKGTVTQHFAGNLLVSIDCGTRCNIDQNARTITVL
ncbi:MAG: hypothetical protein ABIP34_17435 [Rhodoferax sp.]|uniref:hypothetical protein n=1 Tax=Rhodoferax sp. TaxID=50421 RepID=UPI003266DB20